MPIHSRKRSRLCLPPPSSGRFLVRWRSCGDPELRPWRPSVSRDLDADWGTGRSGRNPHEGGKARTEWAGLVEGGRPLRFRVGPNDDPPLPPAMFFRLLGFVGWGETHFCVAYFVAPLGISGLARSRTAFIFCLSCVRSGRFVDRLRRAFWVRNLPSCSFFSFRFF